MRRAWAPIVISIALVAAYTASADASTEKTEASTEKADASTALTAVIRNDDCKACKDLGLPVCEWNNPALLKRRGRIVILPGLTQHTGSFDEFGKHLARQGFDVYAIDMRGHGRWHFQPEKFANGRYVDLVLSAQDLNALLHYLRAQDKPEKNDHVKSSHASQEQNHKIICIGSSSGCGLLMQVISESPGLADGAIITSAGWDTRLVNFWWFLRDFFSHVYALYKPMDLRPYITRYATSDKETADFMNNDPLARDEMNGRELIRSRIYLNRMPGYARRLPASFPVLIIQGGNDKLLTTVSVQFMHHRMHGTNKELTIFPGYDHVLLGTPKLKAPLLDKIDSWLSVQAP